MDAADREAEKLLPCDWEPRECSPLKPCQNHKQRHAVAAALRERDGAVAQARYYQDLAEDERDAARVRIAALEAELDRHGKCSAWRPNAIRTP